LSSRRNNKTPDWFAVVVVVDRVGEVGLLLLAVVVDVVVVIIIIIFCAGRASPSPPPPRSWQQL
jgi:hypothetical protein